MDDRVRRAVAYIAYTLITGQKPGLLQDLARGGNFLFTPAGAPPEWSIYDDSQRCNIQLEPLKANQYHIFHSGAGADVDIEINKNRFFGYDESSGTYFSGMYDGSSLTIDDLGTKTADSYRYAMLPTPAPNRPENNG